MRNALLIFALCALSGSASAACSNDVEQLDIAFQAATGKKDVATIDRMLPEDYVLITSKGQLETKAGLLAEARDPKVVYTHQEDSQRTVRIWGDTAIITAVLWAAGTEDGRPFDYRLWFSDVYLCTPKGWRYTFGQAGPRFTGG